MAETFSKLGLSDDLTAQILGQVVVPIQRRWREKAAIGRKRANEVCKSYKKVFAFEDFKLSLYVWEGVRWCCKILDCDDIIREAKLDDDYEKYGDVVNVGPCLEIGWEKYNGINRFAHFPRWYEPTIHTRNEAMEAVCTFLYASNVAFYGTVYN